MNGRNTPVPDTFPANKVVEVSMSERLAGKRVLVTGATGFIGGHLSRRLHAEGAHVLALERTPGKGASLARQGIEVVQGDITDYARMEAILRGDVQIVVHTAAWLRGRPLSAFETVNVTATQHLAQISASTGVERFILVSSIAVYGPHGDTDVDENTPVQRYGDPYGDSKIRAEEALHQVALQTGLPYVIVRPGMVYGPGSPGWTVRMAQWAKAGLLPLIDGGRGTAYPVYIDNLVDLLFLCAVHPRAVGEVFNGVDDGPVTMADFLGGYMQMIPTRRAVRLPGWAFRAVMAVAAPFVRQFNLGYVANVMCGRGLVLNRKAKELLGWRPSVSLIEGLRRSEMWLREQGLL
jgi:nucleoside-diphosphate-sugar epimerase